MTRYRIIDAADILDVVPNTVLYRSRKLGLHLKDGWVTEDQLEEIRGFPTRNRKNVQLPCVQDVVAEIEEERIDQKISKRQFSDMVGISYQHQRDIVNGKRTPSHRTLHEMADTLGMKLVYMIMEVE